MRELAEDQLPPAYSREYEFYRGRGRGGFPRRWNHRGYRFVRPVRAGRLQVTARAAQQGRTLQLWDVGISDEAGKLVAKGRVRLAIRPLPEAGPESGPEAGPDGTEGSA